LGGGILILITGITGLTGRFLLGSLRESGYHGLIRCLVREHSDISWVRDDKVDFIYGDVSDACSLLPAFNGVDGVIHLVNIRFSPQIIEACNTSGVKRILIVSTTGVFSKYRELSKEYQVLEKQIAGSGLDYTIIRPTMIYGNQRDRNIHKLVKIVNKYALVPIIGNGEGLMQPIYAQDLATVIARAYLDKVAIGKAYNVAGKEPVSYFEVLQLIAENLGKKRRFIRVPFSLALAAGFIAEKFYNGLITSEKVKRLREDKVFDYSEAEKDLNFSPVSFAEGIRLEIEALKKAGVI
jgi:nucleoside-diphosphate-sugar epimerase